MSSFCEYNCTNRQHNIDVKTTVIKEQLKKWLYGTETFMKVGWNPLFSLPGLKQKKVE